MEHHGVEYRHSCVNSYLKKGWRKNNGHVERGQLSIEQWLLQKSKGRKLRDGGGMTSISFSKLLVWGIHVHFPYNPFIPWPRLSQLNQKLMNNIKLLRGQLVVLAPQWEEGRADGNWWMFGTLLLALNGGLRIEFNNSIDTSTCE